MPTINMLEAKSSLSRLVEAVESGRQAEVVIARHGRPVARLVAYAGAAQVPRLGVAKGKFVVPDDIDQNNAEVEALFTGRRA